MIDKSSFRRDDRARTDDLCNVTAALLTSWATPLSDDFRCKDTPFFSFPQPFSKKKNTFSAKISFRRVRNG